MHHDKDGFDSGCEEDLATLKIYQKLEVALVFLDAFSIMTK